MSPRVMARVALLALLLPAVHAAPPPAGAPLTLRAAVDAALAGNPELKGFAFRMQAQAARVEQAAQRPAPELAVDIENVLGTGDYNGADAMEGTFSLSQVVELGGRRDARTGAARAEAGLLEVEQQARQLDVLAEVTRRFIGVAARQAQARLAAGARDIAAQNIAAAELRVAAARSPHAELDRARIDLDRARLAEQGAAAGLDAARRQLAATWGGDPPSGTSAVGEVAADLFDIPPVPAYGALVARLEQSPDFLRFASETRLRDAELRLASTLRRPDLTLGLGLRRLQETRDEALVASFSVPIGTARRAAPVVAEARAHRDLVGVEREAARVRAEAALYELHSQLAYAALKVATLRNDTLPRLAEAVEETRYAYERGRYGYLELVDAQREYLSLQQELIDPAADSHLLRAEIERLTNAPLAATTP